MYTFWDNFNSFYSFDDFDNLDNFDNTSDMRNLRHSLQFWQLKNWIHYNLCWTWQLIVTLDSIRNSSMFEGTFTREIFIVFTQFNLPRRQSCVYSDFTLSFEWLNQWFKTIHINAFIADTSQNYSKWLNHPLFPTIVHFSQQFFIFPNNRPDTEYH